MASRRHPRRTRAEWTQILAKFESSELSAREFCMRNGFSVSSFQRWRQLLSKKRTQAAPEFVELAPSSKTQGWSLDIKLPNGVELRFQG